MKQKILLENAEVIEAITNYIVDAELIDPDIKGGYMNYEINEDGILEIELIDLSD